jgi:hypothetical protein
MIDVNNYVYLDKFLSIEDKKNLRIVNKLLKNIIYIEKIKIDLINKKYRKHKDYCKNIFCENNNNIEISSLFPELTISKYPYVLNKLNRENNTYNEYNEYNENIQYNDYSLKNNYCQNCINKYNVNIF